MRKSSQLYNLLETSNQSVTYPAVCKMEEQWCRRRSPVSLVWLLTSGLESTWGRFGQTPFCPVSQYWDQHGLVFLRIGDLFLSLSFPPFSVWNSSLCFIEALTFHLLFSLPSLKEWLAFPQWHPPPPPPLFSPRILGIWCQSSKTSQVPLINGVIKMTSCRN